MNIYLDRKDTIQTSIITCFPPVPGLLPEQQGGEAGEEAGQQAVQRPRLVQAVRCLVRLARVAQQPAATCTKFYHYTNIFCCYKYFQQIKQAFLYSFLQPVKVFLKVPLRFCGSMFSAIGQDLHDGGLVSVTLCAYS